MPKYVIDIAKWRSTGSWIGSLTLASKYKAKDIGKKYWPPMDARVRVKVPVFSSQEYYSIRTGASKALPKSFNWADSTNSGVAILPVQNQGPCGSCWAVSSATCMGDDWGIAANQPPVLLAANSISNCTNDEDCQQGGYPSDAAITAARNGLLEDRCWPYSCDCVTQEANGTPLPQCTDAKPGCSRWYVKPNTVRAAIVLKGGVSAPKSTSDVDVPATLDLIKQAIITTGPVVTGFRVPSDLLADYPSDPSYVFRTGSTDFPGWHAVVITGWNVDAAGKLYWVIRNSWGTGWGYGGYFNAYAYDPEYEKSNLGFDVPLFNVTENYRTESIARLSVLGPKAQLTVTEDDVSGPMGGVTLWNMDLARSPKTAPTLSFSQKYLSKPSKKTVTVIVSVIAVLVVIAIWWILDKRYQK